MMIVDVGIENKDYDIFISLEYLFRI